jgi:hypothetical protein
MKTLVCVNVLDNVDAQVYGSHCQEWFRVGRTTQDNFLLFHPNRLSIDTARNQAARIALQQECDYLYFIDDDMILHPNTYNMLKESDGDIVAALTYIRSYPFNVMAFKDEKFGVLEYFNNYKDYLNSDGTFYAEAVGFACCLIKCSLLKQIRSPYFVTGSGSTEDVYFCLKAKETLGDKVSILVNTKCPTKHRMMPEFVGEDNVDDMLKHYAIPSRREDRGKDYLERCKSTLGVS